MLDVILANGTKYRFDKYWCNGGNLYGYQPNEYAVRMIKLSNVKSCIAKFV